jgi:Tfp pilus assembly protein PilF
MQPSKEIIGDKVPQITEDETSDTTDDDKQEIELNFALGDFSETSLAKAEEELQNEVEDDQKDAEGSDIDQD